MAIESREHAISILKQYVHGEISGTEFLKFVRGRDCYGLEDLLDTIQLRTADYAAIALSDVDLCCRIEHFLMGEVHLPEFADWVYQLHRIHASSEYQNSEYYSRQIEIGLMLLALIVDLDLTEGPRLTKKLARLLQGSLQRSQPIPSSFLLRKLLSGKQCLHLATRQTGESLERPWRENQWVEIVLLSQPMPPHQPAIEDSGWFTPLVICTREYWMEGAPGDGWAHPENDKVLALKEDYPHLSVEDFSPQYYVDPEGLVEVVLDAEEIETPAIEVAVRLFCLVNHVKGCYLNGKHVYPAEEDI